MSKPFQPNLTTTFQIFERQADVVVSRANFSIISVTNPTAAIQQLDMDRDSYRMALRWLLNFTAADVPAPSAIAQYFWSSPEQLSSDYWSPAPRQVLYSVLAYPLWLFQINNNGNPAHRTIGRSSMPQKFRIEASIASPFTKIQVNHAMFIVFLVLEVRTECILR